MTSETQNLGIEGPDSSKIQKLEEDYNESLLEFLDDLDSSKFLILKENLSKAFAVLKS